MARYLIPFDGSDNAARAVRYVVTCARRMRDAPYVVLLNVQPPIAARDLLLEGRPSEIHRLEAPEREHGDALLRPPLAELGGAGLRCQPLVEFGEPAQAIARAATAYHCDQIVMGARGLNAFDNLILGSVSKHVIQIATVPVLVVK
jgi:nucleotide-binding universal stress UspA family protein